MEWQKIKPNKEGDWLNQRSEEFGAWPVIGQKKGASRKVFNVFSAGLQTNRDSWVYSSSASALDKQVATLRDTYSKALEAIKPDQKAKDFLKHEPWFVDSTRSKWSSSLENQLDRRLALEQTGFTVTSLYRPFHRQNVYFDSQLNHRRYQLQTIFPTPVHRNIGFYQVGNGSAIPFSVIATNLLPDLHVTGAGSGGQYFPRFTWSAVEADDGGLFGEGSAVKQGEASVYGSIGEVADGYVRVDNITDEIKALYRDALGSDITGDDIFHFVYGKLHDPVYRTKYAADLKKMLPHIETPSTRAEFDKFAAAGQELMDLHVNYETVEPWPLDIQVKGDEADRETWRVLKMKWAKRKDPETGKNVNEVTKLIYNKRVTIAGIPEEADEYMLGSRSAVAWLIDRYQVKKDKASGIVNDPNDWADEVGNPRYIVDLIGKVVRVAMETVRIVDGLGSE